MTAYQYAVRLNEGIDHLKPYVGGGDRIFSLDESNPFPLAFGIPYAGGAAGFYTYGLTVDEHHYPPASEAFRAITLVMEPRRSTSPPTGEFLERVYGPLVRAQFEKIDESRLWIIWRRRAGPAEWRTRQGRTKT